MAEALGESSPFIYARTSLIRALVAATDASCKWEFKLWPQTAKKYGLVLTGWGPNMCTDPTPQWVDKRTGCLTRDHWWHLVQRISQSWRENPHYNVPDGELDLEFVTLEEFLSEHPGTWPLRLKIPTHHRYRV